MKSNILKTAFILSLLMVTSALAMPEMQAAPESAKAPQPVAGKALEVINSGGYTYILVQDKDGFKDWVAVPQMVLAVGDEVEFLPGTQMGEFASKPLNRTFQRIIFSAGPTDKYNEQRKINAHKGVDMSGPVPNPTKSGKVVEGLKVEKAQGLNAFSIGEVLANPGALKDQKVVVRGQVVKVSIGIMGKNWVHIKDGSGGPDAKLIATTRDEPAVGDIVTISGPVHVDVDFGGGYKYPVIMEDAAVK